MKRFWVTTGIIFGLALLFVVGLGVILMLSPGTRLFGLQYVSAFVGKNDVSEEYADYIEGDIYITTNDIPVVLSVEPYGRTKVEFSQHYHGYTTDRTNIPNCKIERTSDGLKVETAEVSRFGIFGRNDKYSLTIHIPASWAISGRHSIYVNGKNSPITLNNADNTTLSFINLSLVGNNTLSINTKLSCKNLTAYTGKAAEFNKNVVAENYDISTGSGNLTFAGTIEGNLKAKTTSGFVHINKVMGDATIKTSTGEVAGIDNAKPIIYGKANIETGRGRVVIDELLSTDNYIKTAGGSINIETMMGGTLESPRGAINVGAMNSGTLKGGTKDIVVGSVSGSATISSTKGNVYVGDFEGSKTARNINASSTNGKITLKNTIGSVSVSTTNGEVELYNSSASAIKLESGKGVVATGLLGKVDISAKKDINLAFNRISGDVNINGTAGCKNINITANKTELENVNVHLKTAGKNLLAKVYEGNSLTKEGAEIKMDSSVSTAKNVKVSATGANVNLYLKQA